MPVVAFANPKGGAGKSTSALILAQPSPEPEPASPLSMLTRTVQSLIGAAARHSHPSA